MIKRVFGWGIFLWMMVAAFIAGRELLALEEVRFGPELGALLLCVALAIIGLMIAFHKKPPGPRPVDLDPVSRSERFKAGMRDATQKLKKGDK